MLKKRDDYCESLDEGLDSGDIDIENLVFLDESGFKLGQTRDHARAEGGNRATSAEPKHLGKNITLVAAMSLAGVLAAMYCTCTFNGDGFETFVESYLIPELKPKQVVILDNVSFHKRESVTQAIEFVGAKVVFLPPYSPELNPIENMWSKLKCYLKSKKVKTFNDFNKHLSDGLNAITESDCASWFDHCGYIAPI